MKLDGYILWGAAAQATILTEILVEQGNRILALFDNDSRVASPIKDVPVMYGDEGFGRWLDALDNPGRVGAIAAIGGDRGRDRYKYYLKFKNAKLLVAGLQHKNAIVSGSARTGENIQLLAGSIVGVNAVLGHATILNTGSQIDHDCVLGNGVHVAPGATLCGCVTVGDFSMIGAGATVLPHITIGRNSLIGAGSVVTKNIPDSVVAYGNPARIVRSRNDA